MLPIQSDGAEDDSTKMKREELIESTYAEPVEAKLQTGAAAKEASTKTRISDLKTWLEGPGSALSCGSSSLSLEPFGIFYVPLNKRLVLQTFVVIFDTL